MNDKPYQNWYAYTDKALERQIGAFVKHHRLQQNKTQQALSDAAGISRSTLSLLERGQTVTVATLIQVLRVLDQLHVMGAFQVHVQISPLALAKAEQAMRKRARGGKTEGEGEYRW